MTKQEWVDQVLARKIDYGRIVETFHPNAGPRYQSGNITAAAAEMACAQVSANIAAENADLDPAKAYKDALEAKDAETLYSLMNSAWFGFPEDSSMAHEWPGFNSMCDLLSDPWEEMEVAENE